MKDPIKIHPQDNEEAARARHGKIESRLNDLGEAEVRRLSTTGGLPPQWDPLIGAWLKGDRLEDEKKPEAEQ